MIIHKMVASFGGLDRAVLTLGDGFTLIEAPNESGKSTWAAFLRAMLYGAPALGPDKPGNRNHHYQPWSGATMEGAMELTWKGQGITIYRGPKGDVPFGAFAAVFTATQREVPFLTSENCGEMLTGVSREVFERTVFVGQGDATLTPSSDLERHIHSLISPGESEVPFFEIEQRLKNWLSRRRSNPNGTIPRLEAEWSKISDLQTRQAELRREAQETAQKIERSEQRRADLEAQIEANGLAEKMDQSRRYGEAQAVVDKAKEKWEHLRTLTESLPPNADLRQAQNDLSFFNSLTTELRDTEKKIPEAQKRADQAKELADNDPYFGGQEPDAAAAQAQSDSQTAKQLLGKTLSPPFLLGAPLGSLLAIALGEFLNISSLSVPLLGLGGAMLWILVTLPIILFGRTRQQQARVILDEYKARSEKDILLRASIYIKKATAAQEAQQEVQTLESHHKCLTEQKQKLNQQLLDFVHTFAPKASDLFGASAAISRALQQQEQCSVAQAKWEAAEKALADLEKEEEEAAKKATGLEDLAKEDTETLIEQLNTVNESLANLNRSAARLAEKLDTMDDPIILEARRGVLEEKIRQQKEEFTAISIALKSLSTANHELQLRLSPSMYQKAGEYLYKLTGGRYDQAALSHSLQAAARETDKGLFRSNKLLSGGTVQQLYLALRLAMCDLTLANEETCPIILDDALDSFDDNRAALALDCLLDMVKDHQVILFTCHTREKALLDNRKAAFHYETIPFAVDPAAGAK